MSMKKQLLDRAKQYAKRADIPLSTLSSRLADDGKFFDRLEQGREITVGRYEKISAKLDELESEAA